MVIIKNFDFKGNNNTQTQKTETLKNDANQHVATFPAGPRHHTPQAGGAGSRAERRVAGVTRADADDRARHPEELQMQAV